MGQGHILTKNQDGTWHSGFPLVRKSTGWVRGNLGYVKTAPTVWTLRYDGDYTPPAAPTMSVNAAGTSITVKSPVAADLSIIIVKRSTSAYPTNTAQDANFDKTMQPDNNWWSQYWAKSAGSRTMPLKYAAGTRIYFSAWSLDSHGNTSSVGHYTAVVPKPAAPPVPVKVTRSAYIDATSSGSWRDTGWRTDNNYVYQAGSGGGHAGFWFYSNRISSALSKAISINKMQVYIQRVNSVHGVSGGATVQFTSHRLQNRPAGSPAGLINVMGQPGTLTRGQGVWFNVPSNVFEAFRTGWHVGFGLQYGATSFTDPHYQMAYGAGTASGRVYVEWVEYA